MSIIINMNKHHKEQKPNSTKHPHPNKIGVSYESSLTDRGKSYAMMTQQLYSSVDPGRFKPHHREPRLTKLRIKVS